MRGAEPPRASQMNMEAWWFAYSAPAAMELLEELHASETMGASLPDGAATCAFDPSSRKSHSATVPFDPAVQTIEFDASNALAHLMFSCDVRIVLRGPWLSLWGLNRVSFWSDEMAANPPATGVISRT